MRHIISLLLENEPGALSRVVGLFSQRNYNIESLTVAPTEDPTLSRLTLTTVGHDEVIEQITKNLNKLVEVVKLVDLSESAHIERELMLVKIKARAPSVLRSSAPPISIVGRSSMSAAASIPFSLLAPATSLTASFRPSVPRPFSKQCAAALPALPVATKCSASNSKN